MAVALPLLPSSELTYRCPGQRGAVSEAVHKARLEADFPACRGCEHGRRDRRPALEFDAGNVRGRGGNVIDRAAVAAWSRSLAAGLFARLEGRPRIVVGYDGRPSSPELFAGLESLREAGCDVLDVGRCWRPVLDFAVHELAADAGVFVTGGVRPGGWNGLDVVGPRATAWSWPGTARDLLTGPADRPRRGGGRVTPVRPVRAYASSFLSSTHDVRPLRVVCYAPEPVIGRTVQAVLEQTPCRVEVRPSDSADAGSLKTWLRPRLSASAMDAGGRFDVAVALRRDGRAAVVCDEAGRVVSDAAVAALLGGGRPVIDLSGQSEEEADLTLRASRAGWGVGPTPAVVDSGGVRRDGLLVLTRLLQTLSSDVSVPLSRRVTAIETPAGSR